MTLPDLFHETDRIGMTFALTPEGKLRWQTREQPSPDLLRSLADHKGELLVLLARQTLPTQPTEPLGNTLTNRLAAEVAAAELALEVDEARRRDFPGGFPDVLARCVCHYMMGPLDAPAEGLVAWWAAARRQVLRMIEAVRRHPEKYSVAPAAERPKRAPTTAAVAGLFVE